MKKICFALMLITREAVAQTLPPYVAPQAPIMPPVVVPVYPNLQPQGGPYGTGYSVITRTHKRTDQDYDQDVTDSETVTSIRPNDSWGNPIITLQEALQNATNGDE